MLRNRNETEDNAGPPQSIALLCGVERRRLVGGHASRVELRLAHLYPDTMNLYADRGNVIALTKRCRWHGIELKTESISIGNDIDTSQFDLVFLGGGQDKEQRLVGNDLLSKQQSLAEMADDNVVMLVVCGGYQLFGNFYRPAHGPELKGLAILDIETIAGNRRLIGNVVLKTDIMAGQELLVGFENHSGKTYLGAGVRPLGRTDVGFGNNGEDGLEGAVYKNVFGTYLHGSLLPKNPQFTDHLITLALKRRYGHVDLNVLDDSFEEAAHKAAVAKARSKKKIK